MIISKEVIIKPNNHSINHYISKGYEAKCRIDLIVKVEDLTISSNVRVDCKCEKCGSITNLKYQDYNICISRNDFYVCEKCKFEKIKITKKIKYGSENYSNSKKRKETMNFLYGCDIPLQNKEILNKKNDTCIKKYGFKNASENEKVINKIRDSHIELFKNVEYKADIVDKRRETCIEKYGTNSYTKTEEHKRKTEEYCLKKYGYKHFGSVPELILKRRESMLKRNLHRSDYFLYKREVVSITRRYLKILFKNWNGYDYYDNEYIKDNFSLPVNSKLYPSVDHKISTYYGFKNNINPEIIANIDNLCITKKRINSKKREKIYEDKLINIIKIKMINIILKKE